MACDRFHLGLEGEEDLDDMTRALLCVMEMDFQAYQSNVASVESLQQVQRATFELVNELNASGRLYWWAGPTQRKS